MFEALRSKVIQRVNSPSSYYIHCNLADKENKLYNGKASDLLACVPISGKPQQRVYYLQHALSALEARRASPLQHVSSVTLTVKDKLTFVTHRLNLNKKLIKILFKYSGHESGQCFANCSSTK